MRINTTITGEPAEWLQEWKRRGLVTSYTDAVIQSLRVFKEIVTEHDLKSHQLRRAKDEQW